MGERLQGLLAELSEAAIAGCGIASGGAFLYWWEMLLRRAGSLACVIFASALAASPFACAGGDTFAPGFENISGVGGAGGAGGDGQATSSSQASSSSTGGGGASSSSSSSSSVSGSSTSSGNQCNDPGDEPNDTESTATPLATIDDCDGSGSSFGGVLDGGSDVDWYKYTGEDALGCVVDATRALTSSGGSVRLCKYAQCSNNNDAAISCPGGTSAATSPDGRPGCCGTSGFDMAPDCASFPSTDDSSIIYIRVDQPGGDCVSYSIDYHF